MSISANDFVEENAGSDSDAGSDDAPDYYQPISAVGDDDADSDQEIPLENHRDNVPDIRNSDSLTVENPGFRPYPNGHISQAENGISCLDLNDDEEEEEERMREASDRAISRAIRDDESRRNAPLTPENSSRIVEAMRGISFGGFAPDWANQVPEQHWMDQLRRLRQTPSTTATRN